METVKTNNKKTKTPSQQRAEAEKAGFNFRDKDNQAALYILFGSRTGNSESAAVLACEYARHQGMEAYLLDMNTMKPENIRHIRNLLIAVSTHGEGDPPEVAEHFYHYLHSDAVQLSPDLRYSVLALGDSTYEDFCKTGHDIAGRLQKLGAKVHSPLAECDVNYEENAMAWVRRSVDAFAEVLPLKNPVKDKTFAFEINKREGDFDDACFAPVLSKKMLTTPESTRRTMMLSLSVKNSGLVFNPGDSVGVYTTNARMFVDRVIRKLQFDSTTQVDVNGKTKMLKEALIKDFELTVLTTMVVSKYFEITQLPELKKLTGDEALLEHYCETRDVLDLITDYPAPLTPAQFVTVLRKLNPRLYSLASSPEQDSEKIDLVAGLIEYTRSNRERTGVCSSLFTDRVDDGETLPVFIEHNDRFRLPDDKSRPLIMIGAGTGIAPYRAFLQEIENTSRQHPAWLFFGEKSPEADFLFREELEAYLSNGTLTRLNVAFSRHKNQKKYVQDLLREKSEELFDWVSNRNAVLYICGNKRTMAKEVRSALKEVYQQNTGKNAQAAEEWLQKLKSGKSLRMDVY